MANPESQNERPRRDIFAFSKEITAPPIFRQHELDQMLSEARENEARPTGPMQHVALIGERGSGKTFLTMALATTLGTSKFRGKVVILPELQPQIQSPKDFVAEVYRGVIGQRPQPDETWDQITAKLDKLFTPRGRKNRLLVVIAENFPELLRRTFSSHAYQTKLRNWLDRAESRVMLVTSSTTGDLDGEPGDPLFGIFHTVELEPIAAATATELLEESKTKPTNTRLFQFLFRETDRSPKSANILALAYWRYGSSDWQSLIEDFIRYNAHAYESIVEDLGHRAAICMHEMIVKGEPISQSDLAESLGFGQQSSVAQPFAEMRRKHLLRENPAPNSRAKLAYFTDRFFVSFYRRRVLGDRKETDLLFLLAEILAEPIPAEIKEAVDDVANAAKDHTRALAFKTFLQQMKEFDQDPAHLRAFASGLISKMSYPPLLADFSDALLERDQLAGFLVSQFVESLRKDDAENRWASCQPDVRAFIEAIGRDLRVADAN